MATTPLYALPYPASTDAANGPLQLQNLATAAESAVVGTYARLTADTSAVVSSTTLVNATGLGLAVAASAVYTVEGWIMYSSATGADIRLSWTLPASATLSWSAIGYSTTVTGGGLGDVNTNASNRATSGSVYAVLGGINVSSTASATLGGTLITSVTSGTAQLQFCQDVSTASNTIICRDSWIRLRRVA